MDSRRRQRRNHEKRKHEGDSQKRTPNQGTVDREVVGNGWRLLPNLQGCGAEPEQDTERKAKPGRSSTLSVSSDTEGQRTMWLQRIFPHWVN